MFQVAFFLASKVNKLLSQMFECLDKVPGASQDEIAEALRLTGWNTARAVKLLKIQKLGQHPQSQWTKRIRREDGLIHTKVKISNQLPDSFTLSTVSQVSSDVPNSPPPVPPAQRDVSPVESVFSSVSPVHSREATPLLSRAASPPASPRARPVGGPGGSPTTTAMPVGGPGPGGSLTTTARPVGDPGCSLTTTTARPVGDPRGSCTTTVRPVESRRAAARPKRFLSQATVPQAPVKTKPARYRIKIYLVHRVEILVQSTN